MNQQDELTSKWIEKLKEEGFTDVTVVELEPNFSPGEHTHDVATTHVVLKGELTITDQKGKKTYREGDRVDFPAGTKHKALFGPQGCSMIVGTKKTS